MHSLDFAAIYERLIIDLMKKQMQTLFYLSEEANYPYNKHSRF